MKQISLSGAYVEISHLEKLFFALRQRGTAAEQSCAEVNLEILQCSVTTFNKPLQNANT